MEEIKGHRGKHTDCNPATAWPRPFSRQSSIWYGWDLAKTWMKLRWMRSRNYYSYMDEIKGKRGCKNSTDCNPATAWPRLFSMQSTICTQSDLNAQNGLGNSCFMFIYIIINNQSILWGILKSRFDEMWKEQLFKILYISDWSCQKKWRRYDPWLDLKKPVYKYQFWRTL